ncbi:MAG: rhomboid family intramembrane serine protease [Myxococcales bacterium]|nr:rhomboid family intramembrane serine protease [Myxococcales bacterium]
MAQGPASEDPEIPGWMLSAGRLFGLSPIQTRWRLLAVARRWRAFRRELEPASRGFEHQICSECGALQPHEGTVCSSCGEKLASPTARVLRKLGLSVPSFLSVSSLLGISFIVIYFRMMTEWRGQGLMGWETEALLAHGGLWPPAVFEQGQWWRLGTANFLHIGVWHVFFNMTALSQVGPSMEDVFGRARMIFFFALTGVLAMGASAYFQPTTPTAGASGALMGLIGVAAGWGHRRKTSQGKRVRDQMIMWAIYTMLFGLVVRANHVAHAAGFVAGGVLGLAFSPLTLEKTKGSAASMIMGVVGSITCGVLVVLALVPPAASREVAAQFRKTPPGLEPTAHEQLERYRAESREQLTNACELVAQGKEDEALPLIDEVMQAKMEASDLGGFCAFVADVQTKCALKREKGLDAVVPPGADTKTRLAIASHYELWCSEP